MDDKPKLRLIKGEKKDTSRNLHPSQFRFKDASETLENENRPSLKLIKGEKDG